MKALKKSLKIDSTGSLVSFNYSLRRWELTYRSWSWSDIDPEHLAESKENQARYNKEND
jgi:hypothetical protein